MKKLVLLSVIALSVWACGPKAEADQTEAVVADSTATETETEETAMADSTHFGEMIDTVDAKSMADLSTEMMAADSVSIKVAAVAKDVCKKKGCWMKVETAEGKMMRVTFKDYGFFVPKDISGKEVVMQGMAYKDTTSVDDLRHYAEDGGATPEEIAAITEPEIATTFVATGVVLK